MLLVGIGGWIAIGVIAILVVALVALVCSSVGFTGGLYLVITIA